MPVPLPLTSERLERHGLYLIEDGQTMFLWVGRDAVPQLIMDVFDLPSYTDLRGGKVECPQPPVVGMVSNHTSLGYASTVREFIFATGRCYHRQDTRDAPWRVSPVFIRCQRGWGAAIAFVGAQCFDP